MILPSSPASLNSGATTDFRTSTTAGEKEFCPDTSKWYYMWLRNEDLRKYFRLLTGTTYHTTDEKATFKCFVYTPSLYKIRSECKHLSEEDYTQSIVRYHEAIKAFEDQDPAPFNALTDASTMVGSGYLFINAPLSRLTHVLEQQRPLRYLIKNHNTDSPASIPDSEIRDFFVLLEILPYNIQLLEHPLNEYTVKKKRIRFTGGIFQGQEACIIRLHRNTHIVFGLNDMTLSIRYLKIFPYEIIEERT